MYDDVRHARAACRRRCPRRGRSRRHGSRAAATSSRGPTAARRCRCRSGRAATMPSLGGSGIRAAELTRGHPRPSGPMPSGLRPVGDQPRDLDELAGDRGRVAGHEVLVLLLGAVRLECPERTLVVPDGVGVRRDVRVQLRLRRVVGERVVARQQRRRRRSPGIGTEFSWLWRPMPQIGRFCAGLDVVGDDDAGLARLVGTDDGRPGIAGPVDPVDALLVREEELAVEALGGRGEVARAEALVVARRW